MRVLSLASLTVSACSLVLVACGSSSESAGGTPSTPASNDAGVDSAVETPDAGPPVPDAAVDPSYPAKHTPIPLVDWNGARIMKAPKIVTVTWKADPLEARLQAFGDLITTTKWWDAVSASYCAGADCVGHGSAGGHVVIADAAAPSYTDTQGPGGASTLQDLIKAQVTSGAFPAPTSDTLYVMYLPSGTTVTQPAGPGGGTATSCKQFGGYHGAVTVTPKGGGADVLVPYAVIPRCDATEKTTTIAASHEIIEAATDPDASEGNTSVAYYMTGNPVWTAPFGGAGEVGDLCVDLFAGVPLSYDESGFTVQRSWSNPSAKASHDPCVPIPAGQAYFNTSPTKDQLPLRTVGSSVTIDLEAFSDGPTADWSLAAFDLAQAMGQAANLTLSLDTKTINNGGTAKLTVTLKSKPSAGYAIYVIQSKGKSGSHLWPGVVVTQ